MFFRRKESPSSNLPSNSQNAPKDRVRLTKSLNAPLWHRTDEDGNRRTYWSVDRVNPDNPEMPFRTLAPKHLLETPEFVRLLAEGFAESESLPLPLRKQLAALSGAMAQVEELMLPKPDGDEDKSSEGDVSKRGRVLSFG